MSLSLRHVDHALFSSIGASVSHMSLSRTPAAKDYVDRGVQTITSSPPSVKTWTPWLARSLSKTSSSRAEKGSLSGCSSVVSPKSHSHSSTQLDSAYSHSLPPDSPSPVRSAAITRRMHKRQQTPYSRPIQQPNKRVVSLPRDPLYDTKTLLEPTTMRVVSLPDRLPSSFPENSFSSDSISLHTEQSFITRDDRYSRIRRVCSSVDAPHTPSPPSSPDSVLIIDDQDQLSDTFLRRKSISDSQQLFSDDEGTLDFSPFCLHQRVGLHRLDHLGDFTTETNPCSSWTPFPTICSLPFVCVRQLISLPSILMVLDGLQGR